MIDGKLLQYFPIYVQHQGQNKQTVSKLCPSFDTCVSDQRSILSVTLISVSEAPGARSASVRCHNIVRCHVKSLSTQCRAAHNDPPASMVTSVWEEGASEYHNNKTDNTALLPSPSLTSLCRHPSVCLLSVFLFSRTRTQHNSDAPAAQLLINVAPAKSQTFK